jgi:hypothetical protein
VRDAGVRESVGAQPVVIHQEGIVQLREIREEID